MNIARTASDKDISISKISEMLPEQIKTVYHGN